MSGKGSGRKRAVIVTAAGFQDEELIYPYYRLLEAGFQVDIATKDGKDALGKYGVPARATVAFRDLREDAYDLVVVPGGHEAPDRVRQEGEVLEFIRRMDERKKVVAAICHGPWVLISAKVVRGRKATCYGAMADDLRNAGAVFVDAPVVEDGNLVTAPHYRNNGDFMRAVLRKFGAA